MNKTEKTEGEFSGGSGLGWEEAGRTPLQGPPVLVTSLLSASVAPSVKWGLRWGCPLGEPAHTGESSLVC